MKDIRRNKNKNVNQLPKCESIISLFSHNKLNVIGNIIACNKKLNKYIKYRSIQHIQYLIKKIFLLINTIHHTLQ